MFARIHEFCVQHNLLKSDQTIIIGLSGGPDSVLLLLALKHIAPTYNLTLHAAHLDHEWRKESADEAQFCKELCNQLNIPIHIKKISEITQKFRSNGSREELARKYRSYFFHELFQKYNAQSVALAHHLDDQIETFFIRLIRGSTITGLSSIKPYAYRRIRPLLTIRKQEIITFLTDNNINFCVDSSNESLEYLRNRIRHTLIPALEKTDSRSIKTIEKTIISLQETDAFLQDYIQEKLHTLTDDDTKKLAFSALLQEPQRFIQTSIILQWLIQNNIPFQPSQGLLEEIRRFFSNQKSTTHNISQQWSIKKHQGYATLMQQGNS